MKIKFLLVALTSCSIALVFTGCNKQSGTTNNNSPTTTTADAAKDLAGKTLDSAKDAATQVATAATNVVSGATAQFTEGVANAKKAIADKNYPGALDELKKLSNLELSDEQKKIVEALKSEAQKLVSSSTAGAADAAKNLIGK
jgi:hypothetical protein